MKWSTTPVPPVHPIFLMKSDVIYGIFYMTKDLIVLP